MNKTVEDVKAGLDSLTAAQLRQVGLMRLPARIRPDALLVPVAPEIADQLCEEQWSEPFRVRMQTDERTGLTDLLFQRDSVARASWFVEEAPGGGRCVGITNAVGYGVKVTLDPAEAIEMMDALAPEPGVWLDADQARLLVSLAKASNVHIPPLTADEKALLDRFVKSCEELKP